MTKKTVFDIDLLDTKSHTTIKRGTATGSYPKEALRKFSKTLPTNIIVNIGEMRDAEHSNMFPTRPNFSLLFQPHLFW